MRDRLQQYISSRKMTPSSFAKKAGLSPATMLRFIKGESGLSLENLLSLLEAYPDLSAEWLLRGNGPMTVTPSAQGVSVSAHQVSVNTGQGETLFIGDTASSQAFLTLTEMLSSKDSVIMEKDRVIAEKDARIEDLINQLMKHQGTR